MIRRKHLGYSDPAPVPTLYKLGGLNLSRTLFDGGQWVDTYVPETGPISEWESVHVLLSGSAHADDKPAIGPGWCSRSDNTVFTEGNHRRTFDEASEYWCIWWTNDRPSDDVQVVKLTQGQTHSLELGYVFLFSGTASVGDASFTASKAFKIESGDKLLHADTDCWLFVWP